MQRFGTSNAALASKRKPRLIPQTSAPSLPSFGGFYASPIIADAGQSGSFMVGGDFDKDGKPDLMVVNPGVGISVYLNDGSGGFKAPISSSLPVTANGIFTPYFNDAQVVDLNGDGYPDLILGGGTFQPFLSDVKFLCLLVSLNQKDGTFAQPTMLMLPNPNGLFVDSYAFSVGATTSSGTPDIVAGIVYSDGSVANDEVLLQTFANDGSATFTPAAYQAYVPSGAKIPISHIAAVLSDADSDSKLDLLLDLDQGSQESYVNVLHGNGDGTFNLSPLSIVDFPTSILTTGMDSTFQAQSLTGSSTRADLVLNNSAGTYVALSNGDGTFQTPQLVAGGQTSYENQVADINGDGKPDLIVESDGALISYLGNGDGTFGPIAGTGSVYANFIEPSLQTVIADFNGDGKADFANLNFGGYIGLGLGNGDGTFQTSPLLYSNQTPTFTPSGFLGEVALDLNGDGVTDVLGTGHQSLIAALSGGKGKFSYVSALPPSAYPVLNIKPITADFNGDGLQDVVFTGDDGTAGVALSKGDGTLKTPVFVIQPPTKLACLLFDAATGDINGDGKMDVVFAYPGDNSCGGGTAVPSGYLVALGNGDGTFKTPVFTPYGTDGFTLALGNFHGKNKPLDLVYGDAGENGLGSVTFLTGNGDGTFGAPATVSTAISVDQILTADYNQDGNPDITLIATPMVYQNGVFVPGSASQQIPGNGDGTFGTAVTLTDETVNLYGSYADVNGDGIPDLIGDGQEGVLSVSLGTGSGQFAAPIHYLFLGGDLLAGNFLGDNTSSFIGSGGTSGGTAFLMNQGGTSLAVTPSATSITPGQSLTLNSALSATLSSQPAPTGTITFYDGTAQIGSGGVGASMTTSELAAGSHIITAVYSGDSHFNPNTSAAVTITVATPPPPPSPDFTFTSAASTLTIAKGSSGTLQFTVSTNASLSASASFQCSGLPKETTCSFSPASLTVGAGSSGTTTLTISTTAASANARLRADNSAAGKWGGIAAAGLLCLLIPRRKSRWLTMVLLLAFGGMMSMTGCSGGNSSGSTTPTDPGTPTGSSTVTVTATAASGGSTITHTSTITLVVQ
ncbi:FG-GAP-like repeat-containing protein [Acidicapsa dinghuensis]|uniref:FG-GAP-like repeat-containing protein n=1 Tax=Acidicapsa dinghuensis TaxID=2218256 RepID=A0ABW1EC71_9BACT|nr:FG-GAP-like repeat-containing protein [Acidicapsa dinghuensis]